MFRVAPGNVGFGEVCGVAPGGVVAYSNGSDFFFSAERNIVEGASTGFKYQCVEFARRWLLQRKGLWLPDVPWAAHIFSMESVEDAVTGASVPMKGIANGKGDRPTVDTLLIFPSSEDYPPGHIAAIVEVTPTHVRIADQNAHFHKWAEGESWSDEIPIIEENGTFTLKDKWNRVPLGWMTFPETATRPLDAPAIKLNAKYIEAPVDRYELDRVTFVPKPSEGKVWLDTTNPAQAKFVEAFGLDANRSRLDESEANYYTMNTELWFACTRAGHSLHNLAIEATKKVLASDELMAIFGLPQQYWARIRRSFETQPYAISGRFDFVIDAEGKQLKTFEYNADSASTLLECAVIQDKWAEHVGVAGENSYSSGRRIGSLLEHAWREAIAGGVVEKGSKLHCLVDNDKEEQYTALYVMEKAEAAGLKTELCTMFDGLEWRGGRVVDKSSGTPVKTVWKTWAWETAISDAAKAATERPADWTPKDGDAVRLCDVLLGDENIHIFEPMWKLIPGNKAIMAVMSEMAPDHPNLLRTEWKLSEFLRQKGYARKPIVGRCGLNVTVHAPGGEVLHETHGQFGNREMVFQELFQLPKRDDYYAILGGWVIGSIYAGTGLREDKSIVTNVESPFSAIRIKVPFKPKLVTHENATDDHLNLKKDKEESK